MTNRTAELKELAGKIEHTGLFFDKFFSGGDNAKSPFLRDVAKLGQNELYPAFFRRHQSALEKMGAHCWPSKSVGRITTGLGNASPTENGFSLHHVFGVPFLPGSGLKGMAAAFARGRIVHPETGEKDPRWQLGGEFYRELFGDTDEAGCVAFFDALPLPDPGNWNLVADVMTPHHQDYNQDGKKPPADWDSPIPVPFLSATGSWQFALLGDEGWTKIARSILERALAEVGFGAKTSSGFGRFFEDKK